ncbi:MAG: sugar ABC transporter permease, partial [Oscillospiraceae bacterium]|nr:sugar ABC transporter permease [Oscillospiraceae bacterium]
MKSSAQNRIRSISYAKYGYFFILPFFIVYFIFQLYPLFNTFKLSLYGNATNPEAFVKLDNFKTLIFGES